MKNNILAKALSLQPETRNFNIKQERYVYKRKSRQYHTRYSAYRTILFRCILHRRNSICKKFVIQSADCRYNPWYAVCQQPQKQAA